MPKGTKKDNQTRPTVSRKKEKIKIRKEINEIETSVKEVQTHLSDK